jgi:hypothetical protein
VTQDKDGAKLPNKDNLIKPMTAGFGTRSHLQRYEEVNCIFQRESRCNYNDTVVSFLFSLSINTIDGH